MGEHFSDGPPQDESIEDAARRATFFRDAETAGATFALEFAAKLVLDSMESGEELDSGRLAELLEHTETRPQYAYGVIDGKLAVFDGDGEFIRFEE